MNADDLDAVLEIAAGAFEPPWTSAHFAAELERPFATCRVREASGEVIAYVIAWTLEGEVEVLSVATRAGHRRAGHARQLVREVLDAACERGAARAFLEVRTDNAAAIALYASLGFREDARRSRYYADGADAVVMVWRAAT